MTPIAPRFFVRPKCPHCGSGHLKRRRFGFYCKHCYERFNESEAVRPKPRRRTHSGSGQIAGPIYHKGLIFPVGRKRAV